MVTEEYRLNKYVKPSAVTLICCGETKLVGRNTIVIDNGLNQGQIVFDENQVRPTIEKIEYQDAAIRNIWQKRYLYRIRLTVKSKKLKGSIDYTIQ